MAECDSYSDEEYAKNPESDQPVDLQVCSILEKDNTNFQNEKSRIKEKSENNSKYQSPLHKLSEFCDGIESYYHDSKISIAGRLKTKQGFMDIYQNHKSTGNHFHSPGLNPTLTSSVSTTFDNPNDIQNNFEFETKSLPKKEFVPKYRQLYSRCSEQSPSLTQFANRTAEPLNLDTSCIIIKEIISSSTVTPNSWPSTGHLQRDRMSPNNIPPIKTKISFPIESNSDDANRKDKTLSGLLSPFIDEKEYSTTSNQSTYPVKPLDFNLMKKRLKLKLDNASKNEIHPQSIRGSILVSECKFSAPILPTTGPPSSGSPGSVSEFYNDVESHCHNSKISITDRPKIKQGLMDKFANRKSWNCSHSPGLNSTLASGVPNTVDNPKDSPGIIPKNFELQSKSSSEREFVPKYRKLYSKCSSQSPAPTQSTNRTAQEFNPVNLDTSCTIIKDILSSSNVTSYPWPSTGHLYRPLQRDQMSPNNIRPIKRKMSFPIESNLDDANRKDKTLKSLLSTSIDKKEYSATDNHLPNQSTNPEKLFDVNLIKNRLKLKLDSASKSEIDPRSICESCYDIGKDETFREPLHLMYPSDYGMQPLYSPPASGSVLRKQLLPGQKLLAPILPTSDPPCSGSLDIEAPSVQASTSDGSTDAGVSSGNVVDCRRLRSLRYTKSGTGQGLLHTSCGR